ncbi:MAG: ECF transporter S component [Candidatus Caldarchaeales archaeon]
MDALKTATGASLGVISAAMAVLPLSFSYPPIPYLRFDLAEVPAFVAALGFGPSAGLLASTIYFFGLLVIGQFSPLGPLMKFLAVISTMGGIWAVFHFTRRNPPLAMKLTGWTAGCLARVAVMSATNYLVLVVFFPDFLRFSVSTLSAFTGTPLNPDDHGIALVLLYTAVFNALHTALSIGASLAVIDAIRRSGALGARWRPWYG